ncbi:MAG: hypothetical protein EP350_03435 [Alphaproteobacteria bacterium]|nr:MAG: hypothetical protein EP350_03435 [Alphaproteobacteria bacterium]
MKLAQDMAAQVLLACLANPEGDNADPLARLSKSESDHLLMLAQRSRCAALIHHIAARAGSETPISRQLAHEARDQALTSLAQARGLVRTMRVLHEAGMEPIALKGVALAYRDYPAPQLRVLRDVDLLLPASEVEQAHSLLLSQEGFVPAPWAGQYGPEFGHQLPEIVDEEHGLVIELHHRLNARGWAGDARLCEMIRAETEEIELMGEAIRVPSARLNLLHLVEHATLHHVFSNGPTILADLHYLAKANALDWEAVLSKARELQLMRPLELVVMLGLRHGAEWIPAQIESQSLIPVHILDAADRAMLARGETHRQLAQLWRLAGRSEGGTGTMSAAARALHPNQNELAYLTQRSPRSRLRWLGYPRWAIEKGVRFFKARSTVKRSGEYAGYASLCSWIAGEFSTGEDSFIAGEAG